jgi:DNA polymerase III subunit gamma/tau
LSYQVIARKYRPQSFDQMVGQNHITQTLTNSLKNDRLPHALLFTGLRGTGKTSSARILAKTLRCQNPVNLTPCNQCQSCQEIAAGRSVDVIEIDGASNNGVDAIRDLRDNVMFMPSSGKYKIFIIDEVHMLSTSAFNALLKTLEEPPAHVIFILATTEVHKIPQTILSRCQRFDFRRIPLKQIAEYLKTICQKENIESDSAALWLIARQGDGSMRDSLSLLDQVISFTNGHLTETQVSQVLGLTERSLVFEVLECLLYRKSSEMVSCLQKLGQAGQNPSLFLEDLSKMLRHSLILKTDPTATLMIDLPEDEIALLLEKIRTVTDADLNLLFDMVIKAMSDLTRAEDSQIVFEIALLRMSQAPQIADLKALLNSSPQKTAGTASPKPFEESAAPKSTAPVAPLAKPAEPVKPKEPLKDLNPDMWLHFIQNVRAKDGFFTAKIENLIFAGCQNLKISLEAPSNLAFLADQLQNSEMRQKLQGFIDSEFGRGYTFEVLKSRGDSTGETAHSLATKKQVLAEQQQRERWESDPRVQKAKEVFKGEIKVVKLNN